MPDNVERGSTQKCSHWIVHETPRRHVVDHVLQQKIRIEPRKNRKQERKRATQPILCCTSLSRVKRQENTAAYAVQG